MTWTYSTTPSVVGLGGVVKTSPDIVDFEALNAKLTPRSLDLIMFLNSMETAPFVFSSYPGWAVTLDATIISTLYPTTMPLSGFVSGSFDTSGLNSGGLRGLALTAKNLGVPVVCRLAHEFNADFGTSFGYTQETAAQFVAGWRHVVDLFRFYGATNVLWDWCANIWNTPGEGSLEIDPTVDDGSGSSWYPGDAYVDIIGLDGYMMTTATNLHTPGDLFLANYQTLSAAYPTKPFAINEFGVAEQSRLAPLGGKAGWYGLFFAMVDNSMPTCSFVTTWERNVSPNDTTIDSSGVDVSAQAAFVTGVTTPRFVDSDIQLGVPMSFDDRLAVIAGADYPYRPDVSCNAADPLVLAILTLKGSLGDADPGALQKKVTTSNVPGTGQIEFDGSTTDGAAVIRFDLTATNTSSLSPRSYIFDVKCKTASGAFFYAAAGLFAVSGNVTTSTS